MWNVSETFDDMHDMRVSIKEVIRKAEEFMVEESERFKDIDKNKGYGSDNWDKDRKECLDRLEFQSACVCMFLTKYLRYKGLLCQYDELQSWVKSDGSIEFQFEDTYVPEEEL